MDQDFRFLRDRTAYWLGVKCLIDKKMLSVTQTLKDEFFKTKEYFRCSLRPNKDERTSQYYKTLNSITIGERV